jgi:hypothetical protein
MLPKISLTGGYAAVEPLEQTIGHARGPLLHHFPPGILTTPIF